MNTADIPEAELIEQIAPGITLQWLHQGRIAYFTIRTNRASAWEAWLAAEIRIKGAWPVERPFLSLHEALWDGAAFTPSIRTYMVQAAQFRPEVKFYSAAILPKTPTAQLVKLVLRTVHMPNGQPQVFFTVQEGIAWLESKL